MTAIDPAERPDAASLGAEFRSLPNESVPPVPLDEPSPEPPDALTRTRVLAPVTTPARPTRRRAVIVASVIAVVLAGGGIATAVALGSTAPASDPGLPALPAPLDQHVDDLWKELGS